MTLIAAVVSHDSIWLLADRRLSYPGRAPIDDAQKVTLLETIDGNAILGYAGLGATTKGTQPSGWMSAVLRGRRLSLEMSFGVLARAVQNQLPRHLGQMPHIVIAPAFLRDRPMLYVIDLKPDTAHKSYLAKITKREVLRGFLICVGGSGGLLLQRYAAMYRRDLLRLVKAAERCKASPSLVADLLAKLNHRVHLEIADRSVGDRCIVAWRFRVGSRSKGGGAQEYYTGLKRDDNQRLLPSIANGMDVKAIVGALVPSLKDVRPGHIPEVDQQEIDKRLAQLPHEPDEELR